MQLQQLQQLHQLRKNQITMVQVMVMVEPQQLQRKQLQHQETLAEMEMVTVADVKSFSQVQVKS